MIDWRALRSRREAGNFIQRELSAFVSSQPTIKRRLTRMRAQFAALSLVRASACFGSRRQLTWAVSSPKRRLFIIYSASGDKTRIKLRQFAEEAPLETCSRNTRDARCICATSQLANNCDLHWTQVENQTPRRFFAVLSLLCCIYYCFWNAQTEADKSRLKKGSSFRAKKFGASKIKTFARNFEAAKVDKNARSEKRLLCEFAFAVRSAVLVQT